ncbi:hypothetical protein [Rubrimonas cliftonensis]|uniref:Uncharacterized protein n=1 Tax=Rubrimonas cliftonensis TaxID=89524 RepID=A0A1H4AKF1_9RHOB|nr:hypothetical protein [Rubrimonas cliftonensis]SEA36258.1 hypothetical protein SAMN05444370_104263 [Rubrimonas cliftonensis]
MLGIWADTFMTATMTDDRAGRDVGDVARTPRAETRRMGGALLREAGRGLAAASALFGGQRR